MRRHRVLGLALLGAAALALAACAGGEAATTDEGQNLVYVATPRALAALDPETGEAELEVNDGVASPDWSRVVRATSRPDGTLVSVLDAETGRRAWSHTLPGTFDVRAVSPTGHAIALGSSGYPAVDGVLPGGRAETTLFIVRPDEPPREIDLRGNVEPEAFTTDEQSLFVLQYFPPTAPTSYQVRRLDLESGTLHDVYSVDGHLQERMGGTARTQTMSPDGTRLYTLYTVTSGGEETAFVHVLSLDEEWAHCVFLPEEFERAPEDSIALAASPDGDRLYAAETKAGTLAEIDTEELRVERTTDMVTAAGPASAAVADDDRVYVGSGTDVTVIDGAGLEFVDRWDTGDPVTGVQLSADGSALYLGTGSRITVVETAEGRRTGLLAVPGRAVVSHVGRGSPPLPPSRTTATCAC